MALRQLMAASLLMSSVAQAEVLKVTGIGTVDTTKAANAVQARMMAERAAKLDAMRNMSELIKIQVTSGTTVEDMEVVADLIASKSRANLLGVFQVSSTIDEVEGGLSAEVVLGICTDKSGECANRTTLTDLTRSLEALLGRPSVSDQQ